jgi:hypothetical protein
MAGEQTEMEGLLYLGDTMQERARGCWGLGRSVSLKCRGPALALAEDCLALGGQLKWERDDWALLWVASFFPGPKSRQIHLRGQEQGVICRSNSRGDQYSRQPTGVMQ